MSVYLPPDYATNQRRYPLAFMFDGQNLFHEETSFSGAWLLHKTLDARAARGKVVPVVIGIHHGGVSRGRELSPWPTDHASGPLGNDLLDWICGPLLKQIERELRVISHRDSRMLGGSSLGGLLALYGFFRHQDVFGSVLCMSPALWVNEGEVFYHVARSPAWGNVRIYLDCGGREAGGFPLQHARWMVELLERKGFVDGQTLMWRPVKQGSHNERSWRRRMPKALRFLYH